MYAAVLPPRGLPGNSSACVGFSWLTGCDAVASKWLFLYFFTDYFLSLRLLLQLQCFCCWSLPKATHKFPYKCPKKCHRKMLCARCQKFPKSARSGRRTVTRDRGRTGHRTCKDRLIHCSASRMCRVHLSRLLAGPSPEAATAVTIQKVCGQRT